MNFGEKLALRYLISKGYRILEHNWTCWGGELDLIAQKNKTVVFVEVKYRTSTLYGSPHEYIDHKKKQRLLRSINLYLLKNHLFSVQWRLDAVCLTKKFGKVQIDHFENILA